MTLDELLNAPENERLEFKAIQAAGKPGAHTRLRGLDRETNKALLLKHMEANGDKGAPFFEFQQVLPSHSRSQIQVLLRELKREGKIYLIGQTHAAKWFMKI